MSEVTTTRLLWCSCLRASHNKTLHLLCSEDCQDNPLNLGLHDSLSRTAVHTNVHAVRVSCPEQADDALVNAMSITMDKCIPSVRVF